MIDIEVDLRSLMQPIRDQGRRPSCLAFATSAAHEVVRSFPGYLAPEYLYYFAKSGPGRGCTLPSMSRVLAGEGQPPEADCPVQSKEPIRAWKPTGGLQVFRRDSNLRSAALEGVFDAIRARQTPVVGLKLPESFFRPVAPWVIRSAGKMHGGHAVVGAGIGRYEGNTVLLIRNSWGLGWADRGYAWLDETFLTKHIVGVMHLTGDLT